MAGREGSGKPGGRGVSPDQAEKLARGFQAVWETGDEEPPPNTQRLGSAEEKAASSGKTMPLSTPSAATPPSPSSIPAEVPRPESKPPASATARSASGAHGATQATKKSDAPAPKEPVTPGMGRKRQGTLLGMAPMAKGAAPAPAAPATVGSTPAAGERMTPPGGIEAVPSSRPEAPVSSSAPVASSGKAPGHSTAGVSQSTAYAPPTSPPASVRGQDSSAMALVELTPADGTPAVAAPEQDAAPPATGDAPAEASDRADTEDDEPMPRSRISTIPPRRALVPPPQTGKTMGMVIAAIALLAIGFSLRSIVDPEPSGAPTPAAPAPAPAPPPEIPAPAPTPAEPAPEVEPALVNEADIEEPAPDTTETETDTDTDTGTPVAKAQAPAPKLAKSAAKAAPAREEPTYPKPEQPVITPVVDPAAHRAAASPKPASAPAPAPQPAPKLRTAPSPRPSRGGGAIVRDSPF